MLPSLPDNSTILNGTLGAISTSLGIILQIVPFDSVITAAVLASVGTFVGIIIGYLTRKAIYFLDKKNYRKINES